MEVAGGSRSFTEFFAEPGQMHIHGLVGPTVRLPPYLSEQFSLPDEFALATRQVHEKIKCPGCQIEMPSIEDGLMRIWVKAKATDDDDLAVVAIYGPPKDGPDPRFEVVS
jgi:hypothetical protein